MTTGPKQGRIFSEVGLYILFLKFYLFLIEVLLYNVVLVSAIVVVVQSLNHV